MKNKTQFALIVAAALFGSTQAKAEPIKIQSEFTPLENLSAQERAALQQKIVSDNPNQQFDWNRVIMGKNEDGQIEVREKNSLKLQAVSAPTCID